MGSPDTKRVIIMDVQINIGGTLISVGLTGEDWEPNASMRYFAQIEDGTDNGYFVFGPSQENVINAMREKLSANIGSVFKVQTESGRYTYTYISPRGESRSIRENSKLNKDKAQVYFFNGEYRVALEDKPGSSNRYLKPYHVGEIIIKTKGVLY